MKVLFLQRVVNVGKPGDIKEVTDSYARNFLIPKGLVKKLTPQEEKTMELKDKQKEKTRILMIDQKHEIVDMLNGQVFEFALEVGVNGKVFGGVQEKEVVDAIRKKFKIDLIKANIKFPTNHHIKELGDTQVYVDLGKNNASKIIIRVIKK